ncbi:MAG: hypothetical protein WA751_11160 [Candidatus Dormiibacterota bacterium]
MGNVVGPAQAEPELLTLGYLVFSVITVFVVRRVALQPGPWLGLRVVRRGVVVLTLLAAAIMGSPLLVFIALLICLPTMIVAWLEPDPTMPAPRATGANLLTVRLAMAMVTVTAKGKVRRSG